MVVLRLLTFVSFLVNVHQDRFLWSFLVRGPGSLPGLSFVLVLLLGPLVIRPLGFGAVLRCTGSVPGVRGARGPFGVI
eukprot:11936619-Heterocapsa_arctica.AAC.1